MKRIRDVLNKNVIIQAYMNEYGLEDCLQDYLINLDITGLDSIEELEHLLLLHDNISTNKLNIIKRKYMTYVIDNYFDGNFNKIYNELDIKDQDIDLGSSIAIKKINELLKDK